MRYLVCLIGLSLTIIYTGCDSAGISGPKIDLTGFQTESIGGGAQAASFFDSNNWPLSQGHAIQGVQNGAWLSYHPNSKNVKTLTNYINGKKNGPEFSYTERGQIEAVKHFRNNELHGLTATYRSGRPITETTYAQGKIHGPFAVYDEFSGKIQRSGTYKNGQFDGDLYFYGANEEVTVKYVYKNGEKIDGGIINE